MSKGSIAAKQKRQRTNGKHHQAKLVRRTAAAWDRFYDYVSDDRTYHHADE